MRGELSTSQLGFWWEHLTLSHSPGLLKQQKSNTCCLVDQCSTLQLLGEHCHWCQLPRHGTYWPYSPRGGHLPWEISEDQRNVNAMNIVPFLVPESYSFYTTAFSDNWEALPVSSWNSKEGRCHRLRCCQQVTHVMSMSSHEQCQVSIDWSLSSCNMLNIGLGNLEYDIKYTVIQYDIF